jgi:hypothetical protein
VRILKQMRRERSGLERTCLEHARYEELAGHQVAIREPQGQLLWGQDFEPDVVTIHSQMSPDFYHERVAKIFICHGEPLSSVGNGVSFKAILDLAPVMDCFICMRQAEWPVWNLIKRTYVTRKGVDLDAFKPFDGIQKLEGEPSILYYENQRGTRNPLYPLCAMMQVWKKLPKARFHIYNIQDQKQAETWHTFVKQCKLWPFVRTLSGPVKQGEVCGLLNRADIVVSALYPLSARGIEALACGRAYVSAGYDEPGYPWRVADYSVDAFAETMIACAESWDKINYRQWAEAHHNEADATAERLTIYERYLP